VDGPLPPTECLPPNGFSCLHPELVRPSPHFYLQADYLLWWVRKAEVPPLVTMGSLNDMTPGALGQPNTVALIGPGPLDQSEQSGVRVTALYWFDQDHTWGVEATGFWLANSSVSQGISGDGNTSTTVIARPFLNANTLNRDADPIVVPNVQSGSLNVTMKRQFLGAEANLRLSECTDITPFSRFSCLAGVRYLSLNEKLQIAEQVTDLPDSDGNPGNSALLNDNFLTYNRFYGAQVGLEAESRVGPVVFTLAGKVAVGDNNQVVKINGVTVITEPDGVVTTDATRGLLTQPTNVGRFSRNKIAVVPEADVGLALEFNEHLRVSVGYNFLFWTDVLRPGDQIDPVVNVGPVGFPGVLGSSPHPAVPFHTSGFWAQGFIAGLQVSY